MAYQNLDIKLAIEDAEISLMEIIKILRPSWTRDEMDMRVSTGIYFLISRSYKFVYMCYFNEYYALSINFISKIVNSWLVYSR